MICRSLGHIRFMFMSNDSEMQKPISLQLRAKRLVQIASLIMVSLTAACAIHAVKQNWTVVVILAFGITMMGVCLLLNRRGHTDGANLLLLYSITAATSALIWWGEGLNDAALLAYPAILIMASLLAQRRTFLALLTIMLAFLVVVCLATGVYGVRVDEPKNFWLDHLRDTSLVLLVSACIVWIIINDLHQALVSLRVKLNQLGESQKHLTYLSQHDDLTGLANRFTGRDRIEQAINQANRHRLRVAVLFVDVDNFKTINDALGHTAGDDILKQIAARLSQSVRKSDIVIRHGGDEFVIGLIDMLDAQDISTTASTILEALAPHFKVKETELSVSCSIGIALYPDDGNDYEALLRLSDVAMYQAKESGRNAFCFFNATMNANSQQNLLLVSELHNALAGDEFVLHYQPVIDLNSGRLVGAEALVRWQHPIKGLVPPGDFIPAAEKSGVIMGLGKWVLNEACRQMVAWQAEGLGDFVMSVNLSPVQFRRGNIADVVQEALEHSGLPARFLELEITESTLIQDSLSFMESLQQLKVLGVNISIDDFGTGYSNLSYLQRFAVNKLKIDRSFVLRLQQGPQELAIVKAIIQMAKSLNLSTAAEGIEEHAVRQTLKELGCDTGQGYLFARPQPAESFRLLISSQHKFTASDDKSVLF